jgi:hypothetical protein
MVGLLATFPCGEKLAPMHAGALLAPAGAVLHLHSTLPALTWCCYGVFGVMLRPTHVLKVPLGPARTCLLGRAW